jgi:hypothetical protein
MYVTGRVVSAAWHRGRALVTRSNRNPSKRGHLLWGAVRTQARRARKNNKSWKSLSTRSRGCRLGTLMIRDPIVAMLYMGGSWIALALARMIGAVQIDRHTRIQLTQGWRRLLLMASMTRGRNIRWRLMNFFRLDPNANVEHLQ